MKKPSVEIALLIAREAVLCAQDAERRWPIIQSTGGVEGVYQVLRELLEEHMKSNTKPLEWFEECFVNQRHHIEQLESSLAELQARLDRSKADLAKNEARVAKARAAGKTHLKP